MHWEKDHFYPYIGRASFDFEKAKKDIKRNYGEEAKRASKKSLGE